MSVKLGIGSSSAIGRMGAAACVPYSTVERMTRPLKDADRWPHRANPFLRPEHLASLIAAFSAHLPSDALRAVEAVESLGWVGFDEDNAGPAPNPGGVCSRLEAAYPIGDAADGLFQRNLLGYIVRIIETLADMQPEERATYVARMTGAEWTLSICLAPRFASIAWYEDASAPYQLNALAAFAVQSSGSSLAPDAVFPASARKRVSTRWHPPPQLDLTPQFRQGVERLVWIPFSLLAEAAEICLDARRSTANQLLPLVALVPGRAEVDGDTANLETMRAAGPGSRNGPLSGQSNRTNAGHQPAKALSAKLDSAEPSARGCHGQRHSDELADRFHQPDENGTSRHAET